MLSWQNIKNMRRWAKTQKILIAICFGLMMTTGGTQLVSASCFSNQQTCSSNYGVNEVFFGNGGELNTCSGSYCAKTSVGETGVGQTCSSSYCAQVGFNTDRLPFLQFVVTNTGTPSYVGVLQPGVPKTAIATFSVKNYLSSGYSVTTTTDPPTNGSYMMSTPSSPETISAMSTNSHEFGMNLTQNSGGCGYSLSTFGLGPAQTPDNTFGFGYA